MPVGTVKFFNANKGFGFITPENGGTDVFVHISSVQRSGLNELYDGQTVEFEIGTDKRSGKSAAQNIRAL